ncbi:hypothetical protein D3C78_1629740 [compost metagenome]
MDLIISGPRIDGVLAARINDVAFIRTGHNTDGPADRFNILDTFQKAVESIFFTLFYRRIGCDYLQGLGQQIDVIAFSIGAACVIASSQNKRVVACAAFQC